MGTEIFTLPKRLQQGSSQVDICIPASVPVLPIYLCLPPYLSFVSLACLSASLCLSLVYPPICTFASFIYRCHFRPVLSICVPVVGYLSVILFCLMRLISLFASRSLCRVYLSLPLRLSVFSVCLLLRLIAVYPEYVFASSPGLSSPSNLLPQGRHQVLHAHAPDLSNKNSKKKCHHVNQPRGGGWEGKYQQEQEKQGGRKKRETSEGGERQGHKMHNKSSGRTSTHAHIVTRGKRENKRLNVNFCLFPTALSLGGKTFFQSDYSMVTATARKELQLTLK